MVLRESVEPSWRAAERNLPLIQCTGMSDMSYCVFLIEAASLLSLCGLWRLD